MTQGKTVSPPAPTRTLVHSIGKWLVSGALPGELVGFGSGERAEAATFMADVALQRPARHATIRIAPMPQAQRQRLMRVAIVNDDMPFLVDSVCAEFTARGLAIARVLHPLVGVARDEQGVLTDIGARSAARPQPESLIYLEVERADGRTRREIAGALAALLDDVRAAVRDWRDMAQRMRDDAEGLGESEGAALLNWFADNRLTLLGQAVVNRSGAIARAIGIAESHGEALLSLAARQRAIAWFEKGGRAPLLLKSNLISPIHRRVPIELVLVPVMFKGKVSGISLHAGLWTSAAIKADPHQIPVLRERMAALQTKLGFAPASHAGKALTHALTALPHDILIAIDEDSLKQLALATMSLADRPRPYLALARTPLERHLDAFVWLPRDELTTARRVAIARRLGDAANAPLLSWMIHLDDSGIALIHYSFDIREAGEMPDAAALNRWLEDMIRGWSPAVEAALADAGRASNATRLALRYAGGFALAYRAENDASEAARDILCLDALAHDGDRKVRLFRRADDAPTRLRLKIFTRTPLALSDAVPVLENFGFRVVEEAATALSPAGIGHIHRFLLDLDARRSADATLGHGATIEEAIAAVLNGIAENDAFNQLIVTTGLSRPAVTLLRTLFRYLRQTGQSYGQQTVADALQGAPVITRALVTLFEARHDPAAQAQAQPRIDDAEKTIDSGLARIVAIDDDRILRLFRATIRATLRTNMFAPAATEALAFKFDSARVPGLPAPLPWREIFVYSPRVEGIHLRAGPVARGGLRWSDRRDDFRTEILGLMKAQRVKNAVIVPTGAKGGFYPKALPDPAQRDAWLAEGTECYRIFIRTLLSVTDNLVEGKVVHPAHICCHDGDDPYFVVAADKGTATFSDVANAIALERGFWLGDAFASGGSVGYDHKAMGITARGGWLSVRRHFAEMGVDIQSEPVRVVGCGDMSGDVFGNGMLLSKSIKLVAAFDHRHIFFDPNPDCEKSWEERARLFALPRSSWADYDARLISKGGGIFPRNAKSIKLSREMRALLAIDEMSLEPAQLIQAILRAPVGLIWFGGIGTYLKARSEANSDAGDRANDANRINAEEVRAQVIGEGANLGMTQAARIAYALAGGRVNTDFIDNSAGVDCSDNEVNIKIALNAEVAAGRLTMPARNKLLVKMTDDVAALVLDDNRLQTLALSIAQRDGMPSLPAQIRLIETFEASGRLDRAVEGIAANDLLLRRAQDGQGLTRPELAVLLATAKLALQDAIEHSPLGHDPATHDLLISAFPGAMQKKFAGAIESHRLRGEIIATKLANRIVNRLGLIHPFELAEEESATLGDVAEAFVIAEAVYAIPALWDAIDAGDMPEATRLMLYDQVAVELRAHMADILRNADEDRSNADAIAAYAPTVALLASRVDGLLAPEARKQTQGFAERLAAAGAPKRIAERVTRLAELDGAIGLAALAARTGTEVTALTRGFTAIGAALGLDWAQGTAMQLGPRDPWERLLAAGLARDFQAMRLDYLGRLAAGDPATKVAEWLATHRDAVKGFTAMVARARQSSAPTPAMLAQIAGQARLLLAR